LGENCEKMKTGKKRKLRIPKIHPIHPEGVEILVGLFIFILAVNVALYYFASKTVFNICLGIGIVAFLFVANFFRSPRRMTEHEEDCVIAPADGKIVAIEPCIETEYFKEERMKVSIFMSIFNVHVNWVPIGGLVKQSTHHSGRFQAAYLPKSSSENEHSTIVIESDCGAEIVMNQVAGALARRIVTYPKDGDYVDMNNHLGFIKFGSRIDLYLPMNAEILVKMNQLTMGNKTPIARLKTEENIETNQENS